MSPLGVEWGVKYTLTGPDGTIAVFNDSTDANFVGYLSPESSGLDSPEVREDAQDSTEADGGVHGNFFYGRRPVILQGTIKATTATDRNAKVSKLLRASNAMRGNATLKWKPQGATAEVFVDLRRQQPPRLTKGFVKDFFLPMVSSDAQILSMTLKTASATGQISGPTATKSPSYWELLGSGATGTGGNWTTANNALVSDNAYAKVTGGSSGHSEILWLSEFKFSSIPSTATIFGVEVEIERKGVTVKDYIVQLFKNSNELIGTNQALSEAWPAGDAVKVYGGVINLMGAALTPAIMNSNTSGIAIAVMPSSGSTYTGEVDSVKMKVYYVNAPIKITLNNEGDASALPILKVVGPATNITLKNSTTGKSIKINYPLGAAVVMEVDFENHTIKTNTGINLYSKLDQANSQWWDLAPGENKIEAIVESAETASTKVEGLFRDTWI